MNNEVGQVWLENAKYHSEYTCNGVLITKCKQKWIAYQ